jgi:hypothetical protein
MKRYRVYYAGAANDGFLLNASSWREAAFTFFSNRPEKRTIFVGRTSLFEREVPYERLRELFPESDEIVAKFGGTDGLIAETLRRDYAAIRLGDAESAVEAAKIHGLKVRAITTGATFVAYVAYRIWTRH